MSLPTLMTESLELNIKVLISRKAVSSHKMVVTKETVYESSREKFDNNKGAISVALSGSSEASSGKKTSAGGKVGYGPFSASGEYSSDLSDASKKSLAGEFTKTWDSTLKVVGSAGGRELIQTEEETHFHHGTSQIFATVTKTLRMGDAVSTVVEIHHMDVDDPAKPMDEEVYKRRAWEEIVGVEMPTAPGGHTVTIPPASEEALAAAREERARLEANETQGFVSVLGELAKDKANRAAIREAGGIRRIVAAMATHGSAAKVQEEACHALAWLAECNPANQDAIREAGGIPPIIAAMAEHRSAAELQRWACYALGQLAANNDANQAAIREAGGIPLIVAAMETHGSAAEVQERACAALAWLAEYNPANKDTIREAGGIRRIVGAMETNRSAAEVQQRACNALYWLAFKNPANVAAIREAGGKALVERAKEEHPDSSDVQNNAKWALGEL